MINERRYGPTYQTLRHHLEKVDHRWQAGELSREINSEQDKQKINFIRLRLEEFWSVAIEKKQWFDMVTTAESSWDLSVQELKHYMTHLMEISERCYKLKLELQDSLGCRTDEMKELFREYQQRKP